MVALELIWRCSVTSQSEGDVLELPKVSWGGRRLATWEGSIRDAIAHPISGHRERL